MRELEKIFWKDAANLNIYYSNFVLSSSVIIHVLAFIFIDLSIVESNTATSLVLRGIPVVFLSILFILIRLKNSFIIDNYKIFFFFSGLVSSLPVIFHASQYLLNSGSLFTGGMGIVLIKVIMVMFVFLPKSYTYMLYVLIDLMSFAGYYYLSGDIFLEKIPLFIIYMFLTNLILLIAYHVNLDLRRKNFLNKEEIDGVNKELKDEMKFKERYFNLIAHDLKSPVSLMSSSVDLIKSGELSKERKDRYINKLGDQLNSLNNLIINVLDWIKTNNKKIDLKPEDIYINELIEEMIELNKDLILNKDLKVKKEIKKLKINTDKTSLQIILNNLIRNAIKFSDTGNTIEIEAKKDDDKKIFAISNIGIPLDNKQIEEFKKSNISYAKNGTLGEKGHGLGLEIVKNLCEMNNLEIEIISENNKTTFKILK